MGRKDTYGNMNRDADEVIVDSKAIKMAYPEIWKEIYEEGRKIGYAERMGEERTKQETKRPASIPQNEDKESKKRRLIKEYCEAHNVSLKDGTLAIGKRFPELFR